MIIWFSSIKEMCLPMGDRYGDDDAPLLAEFGHPPTLLGPRIIGAALQMSDHTK